MAHKLKGRKKRVTPYPTGTVVFHKCEKCGATPAAYRRYLGGKVLCSKCTIAEIIIITTGATALVVGVLLAI